MNELDAIFQHLHRYGAILSRRIDRLYNGLEELCRTSLLLLETHGKSTESDIDNWLTSGGFAVDKDGFFQSIPLVEQHRAGLAPVDAISLSWSAELRNDPVARRHLFSHRNIGSHVRDIHERLGDIGWIYFQDVANVALQYPFIDQASAIPADFDWHSYHTFTSVEPANNPERRVRWTPPTIDYAGEGLILSVSKPLYRGDHFLGLWSIDLPLRYLYQDFAQNKPFLDQDQWIIDSQGLLLLHDRLRAEINRDEGHLFLHPIEDLGGDWAKLDISPLRQRETGRLIMRDADNQAWIVLYQHIPEVDWLLFCGVPESSLEAAAAERLSKAFRQLAEGHYGSQVENSSSSVVLANLAEEFNAMSRRLSEAEQERLKMEQQLRQAQKMEAVGRLAGGVAHDYNNMLNVIMGYTEMMLQNSEADTPIHHDLIQVYKAAQRSMDITRQLLAFARCQTVAPQTLDINSEIKGLLLMLKRLIGEEIELVWQPDEAAWPISIDPTQLHQILVNLCINSRDAIDGIGKIVLETSNRQLDAEYCCTHLGFVTGDFVQLAVSDDGSGMDTDTCRNIFEPFFTTKKGPKGNSRDTGPTNLSAGNGCREGTGLGLATVYGIIKQNNGFINVYSEPGNGTTFRLYFPRQNGTPAATAAGQNEKIKVGNSEVVLVVEDERGILELVRRMLKELGYRVLTANSPQAALQIAEQHHGKIDLLLTDVVLPELNGRQLADQLRANDAQIRVLYMSGYTANIIAKRGVLDADVQLLQKPFTKTTLAAKVFAALHGSDASAA